MSSTLRTQFINHLTLHRRSPKTKEAYISAVYGLARHYMTSPTSCLISRFRIISDILLKNANLPGAPVM